MLRMILKRGVRQAAHVFVTFGLFSVASLNATPINSGVTLAWDPSTDPTVVGYNVYYGTASRLYTNIIPAGTATTAVVTNLSSGVTYYFAATTYNAAGIESEYSLEAPYTVPGGTLNNPPTLDLIDDVTVNQDAAEQRVSLSGITSGSVNEDQVLTVSAFSSNPGLIPSPFVAYNSPDTNASLTFQPVPGSYGTSIITVMVDDGASISNTIIRAFTVTVKPVDTPPTIDLLNDLSINENTGSQTVNLSGISAGSIGASSSLTVAAVSSNPSLVPNPTINYSSPSSTGSLVFTPTTNSFGTAKITVIVMDSQPTNNTTSVSFQITVNQTTPVVGLLTNAVVAPTTTFRFLIPQPATNGDKFNFALGAGAPLGAKVSTRRGDSWLVWTPTMSQASTTNLIGIQITDRTNPALSTNQTVQVVVLDYLALSIGSTSIQAGQSGSVPIALGSSEGVTNLTFTIAWPTNMLPSPSLSISAPGVASSSMRSQGSNLVVNVQMAAGSVLQSSNVIGSILFQSLATQPSGYINLPIGTVSAIKPGSAYYVSSFPASGQVAVVNNLAILQAVETTGPTRNVKILGKVGNTYQLQYATNFSTTTFWIPVLTYSQTNITQNVTVDGSMPNAFYRVQQK